MRLLWLYKHCFHCGRALVFFPGVTRIEIPTTAAAAWLFSKNRSVFCMRRLLFGWCHLALAVVVSIQNHRAENGFWAYLTAGYQSCIVFICVCGSFQKRNSREGSFKSCHQDAMHFKVVMLCMHLLHCTYSSRIRWKTWQSQQALETISSFKPKLSQTTTASFL